MSSQKARIAGRFAAAVASYDAHSALQREAAEHLAQRIAALPLPAAPRVLEIGCGTGHLTRALQPRIGGQWIISDIAPAMVAACRAPAGAGALCLAMDGERPAFAAGTFDLIVASLAVQWFLDLPAALAGLAGLLAPGGRLALAAVGAGSFAEWQAAHRRCGLEAATRRFPATAEFAAAFPPALEATIEERTHLETFADPLDFVRGLRRIGADTPRPGTQPLTAGQLRKVLRALAAQGGAVSYRLLYAIALRSSSTSQPRTTR